MSLQINPNTFESTNTDSVIAEVLGNINGKDISFKPEDATNKACIKALLTSDATSDSFISAYQFAEKFLITKRDDNGGRVAMTDEEIASLIFSFKEEKFGKGKNSLGYNVSPDITWTQLVAKYEVGLTFRFVEQVSRQRGKNEKTVETAW